MDKLTLTNEDGDTLELTQDSHGIVVSGTNWLPDSEARAERTRYYPTPAEALRLRDWLTGWLKERNER